MNVDIHVGDTEMVEFKVDTGADVSVIPKNFVPKLGVTLSQSLKKLFGPGGKLLILKGCFTTTLKTEQIQ